MNDSYQRFKRFIAIAYGYTKDNGEDRIRKKFITNRMGVGEVAGGTQDQSLWPLLSGNLHKWKCSELISLEEFASREDARLQSMLDNNEAILLFHVNFDGCGNYSAGELDCNSEFVRKNIKNKIPTINYAREAGQIFDYSSENCRYVDNRIVISEPSYMQQKDDDVFVRRVVNNKSPDAMKRMLVEDLEQSVELFRANRISNQAFTNAADRFICKCNESISQMEISISIKEYLDFIARHIDVITSYFCTAYTYASNRCSFLQECTVSLVNVRDSNQNDDNSKIIEWVNSYINQTWHNVAHILHKRDTPGKDRRILTRIFREKIRSLMENINENVLSRGNIFWEEINTGVGQDYFSGYFVFYVSDEKPSVLGYNQSWIYIIKDVIKNLEVGLRSLSSIRSNIVLAEAFEQAIKKNDNYTGEHSLQVAEILVILLNMMRKMNRSSRHKALLDKVIREDELEYFSDEVIKLIGLMHDVGKLQIDNDVINLKATMSSNEKRKIDRHPAVGFEVLGGEVDDNKLLTTLKVCTLLHHYYKSGYPNGKKYYKYFEKENVAIDRLIYDYRDGLENSKPGVVLRFLTIVDIMQAMLKRRSYQPERPIEIVLLELWMDVERKSKYITEYDFALLVMILVEFENDRVFVDYEQSYQLLRMDQGRWRELFLAYANEMEQSALDGRKDVPANSASSRLMILARYYQYIFSKTKDALSGIDRRNQLEVMIRYPEMTTKDSDDRAYIDISHVSMNCTNLVMFKAKKYLDSFIEAINLTGMSRTTTLNTLVQDVSRFVDGEIENIKMKMEQYHVEKLLDGDASEDVIRLKLDAIGSSNFKKGKEYNVWTGDIFRKYSNLINSKIEEELV